MSADGPATVPPGSAEDGGLTVAQTAAHLEISTDSVRRRLKAGELAGHQRQAKHGTAWCIHPGEPPGSRDGPATVVQTVAQGSAPEDDPLQDDPQPEPASGLAILQAEAMAAYTRSVLEPLVSALERSEARVADQAESIGRLTAELERAAATVVSLSTMLDAHTATESAPASSEPAVSLWRPTNGLRIILAVLVVAALVAVLMFTLLFGRSA